MSSTCIAAAFYHFVPLDDLPGLRSALLEQCQHLGLGGTILLANEGINGTIAGPSEAVHALLAWLRSDPRLV